MNKDALTDAVMQAAGIETRSMAKAAVDSVFDTVTKELASRNEVSIAGFGVFRAQSRAARSGVNPKTGEKIQIAATTVPKFKAGKALKDAVK